MGLLAEIIASSSPSPSRGWKGFPLRAFFYDSMRMRSFCRHVTVRIGKILNLFKLLIILCGPQFSVGGGRLVKHTASP